MALTLYRFILWWWLRILFFIHVFRFAFYASWVWPIGGWASCLTGSAVTHQYQSLLAKKNYYFVLIFVSVLVLYIPVSHDRLDLGSTICTRYACSWPKEIL